MNLRQKTKNLVKATRHLMATKDFAEFTLHYLCMVATAALLMFTGAFDTWFGGWLHAHPWWSALVVLPVMLITWQVLIGVMLIWVIVPLAVSWARRRRR